MDPTDPVKCRYRTVLSDTNAKFVGFGFRIFDNSFGFDHIRF